MTSDDPSKELEKLRAELDRPSLYDETVTLLASRGFAIPAELAERDKHKPWEPSKPVEEAWAEIYRHPNKHWDLYELADVQEGIDSFEQRRKPDWSHK